MGWFDSLNPDELRGKLAAALRNMPAAQLVRGELPTKQGLTDTLLAQKPFNAQDLTGAMEGANWANPMMAAKIVYHGSPHKFDKFDASKIGTGEGAQAYGHGVYLADSPKVAEGYAKDLGTTVAVDGKTIFQNNKATWDSGLSAGLTDALIANHGDTAAARKMILDSAKEMRQSAHEPWYDKRSLRAYQQELAELRKVRGQVAVDNSGALYKADLPDEWIPKMLDWDKPLSQQPEVKQIVDSVFAKRSAQDAKKGYRALSPEDIKADTQGAPVGPDTGAQGLLYLMSKRYGATPQEAAEMLREAGIPGIRYLDGGSRGAGQGSYNYVVFPGLEDKVKILERNGAPINPLADALRKYP